jgi:hypothetical protein
MVYNSNMFQPNYQPNDDPLLLLLLLLLLL